MPLDGLTGQAGFAAVPETPLAGVAAGGGGRPRLTYEFLKSQYREKIRGRIKTQAESKDEQGHEIDPLARTWKLDDAGAVFDKFASLVDPTGARAEDGKQGKRWGYLNWACTRYLKHDGVILVEDLYKIGEDLKVFDDKKTRRIITGADANIDNYTITTLSEKAFDLRGTQFDDFEGLWRAAPDNIKSETSIIKRDVTGVALVPLTKIASQYWGSGTQWCTAAQKDNAFDYYNNQGPLVILSPAGSKQWYQGHITSPLRDARDEEAAITSALSALYKGLERFLEKHKASDSDSNSNPAPGPEDWSDKDYVLWCVRQSGVALQFAAPELQADRKIVRDAVRQYGGALQFAAPELQADWKIVKDAVRQYGGALEHTAPKLKADPEIVRMAVKKSGWALQYAAQKLRDNRRIVMAAVRSDGEALRYASLKLQADREIVETAVNQNGEVLEFSASALQADRDIVKTAVRQNGSALKFASWNLKTDRTIVKMAVRRNGRILKYADLKLQADRDIVKAAVGNDVMALESTAAALRFDKNFIKELIITNPRVLGLKSKAIHIARPKLSYAEYKDVFKRRIIQDWTIACKTQDKYKVKFTPDLQLMAFDIARTENPKKLKQILHLFPALKDAWFKEGLSLDDAQRVIETACGRLPSSVPVPP